MDPTIDDLKKQIEELKQQKLELEEKLKKYTNNKQHIKYYENHKDVVKERAKNYMEKIKESNPEKLKEWNYHFKIVNQLIMKSSKHI